MIHSFINDDILIKHFVTVYIVTQIILLETDLFSHVIHNIFSNINKLGFSIPIYFLPSPYLEKIIPLLHDEHKEELMGIIEILDSDDLTSDDIHCITALPCPFLICNSDKYILPAPLIRSLNMKISLRNYLKHVSSRHFTIMHAIDILNNLDIFNNEFNTNNIKNDPEYIPFIHCRKNLSFIKLLIELKILTKENLKKYDFGPDMHLIISEILTKKKLISA
jgi:hypothetical protein